MKRVIVCSFVVIILGLLISLGPQFLFKVCPVNMTSEETEDCCADPETSSCCSPDAGSLPICHWSGRAEIGIGFLITALGLCMLIFTDAKTQLGLLIGVFFSSIIALGIPHALIGGCSTITMDCRKVAFPALTVEGIILLVFSAIMIVVIAMKEKPAKS